MRAHAFMGNLSKVSTGHVTYSQEDGGSLPASEESSHSLVKWGSVHLGEATGWYLRRIQVT